MKDKKLKKYNFKLYAILISLATPLLILIDYKINLGLFKVIQSESHSDIVILVSACAFTFSTAMVCSMLNKILVHNIEHSIKNIKNNRDITESDFIFIGKILLAIDSIIASLIITIGIAPSNIEDKPILIVNNIYAYHIIPILVLITTLLNGLKYMDFRVENIQKIESKNEKQDKRGN